MWGMLMVLVRSDESQILFSDLEADQLSLRRHLSASLSPCLGSTYGQGGTILEPTIMCSRIIVPLRRQQELHAPRLALIPNGLHAVHASRALPFTPTAQMTAPPSSSCQIILSTNGGANSKDEVDSEPR